MHADAPAALFKGPVAFYGTVGIEHLLRQARADGRDWYYLDNAYFDCARGRQFRVSKNALQRAVERPDWERFSALKLGIQPWRKGGRHVVVVEQSMYFMCRLTPWDWGTTAWREHVLHTLRGLTDRPIVVRHWSNDKAERMRSLHEDLKDAWALVTWSSAAANEALLAGVPVFVAPGCVAAPMGSTDLTKIEAPAKPLGRIEWAARLAASQWTIEELREGAAWRAWNG